jgi:hypothetical protein
LFFVCLRNITLSGFCWNIFSDLDLSPNQQSTMDPVHFQLTRKHTC